ncbi:WcbI family polysaccharide biosynthesis putative acetyltransferase [Ideonella oryzae]|uniref:WcbI family polysaccharide biosynthesis putative acetyltransferase n=1 Tax=Ideonella oryzae TaxID=2937441 RepID=A0ABT1BQQ8_9BURK|nr:WcbI family polysaccharide biosynthesis putative acetyltransferase [Ideonella oryzae]MCO5977742.1 WcbI family polysaccharide biosynthesis putative acetyltransferase [Ideonella oryzae]
MKKQKLLIISNCQGPALFGRFIRPGAPSFESKWDWLGSVEVHKIQAADAGKIIERIEQADVICTQPIQNSSLEEVKIESLRDHATKRGKRLVVFPALHFDALFFAHAPRSSEWGKDYPFGATEDAVILACYLSGMDVKETQRVFHEVPLSTAEALGLALAVNVQQFHDREQKFRTDIRISDFYADWALKKRLHYIKSHPTAEVYREMAIRLCGQLEMGDFVLERVIDARGNDQFSLPVKGWVKSSLKADFTDDPEMANFENKPVPFGEVIKKLHQFYSHQPRESLLRAVGDSVPHRLRAAGVAPLLHVG